MYSVELWARKDKSSFTLLPYFLGVGQSVVVFFRDPRFWVK